MNEKLKQEIDKLFSRYDNSVIGTSSEEKERIAVVAQHFYNLALEDVRTLISQRLEMHDKDREDFAWMWAEDKRILTKIENLTK